MILSVNIYTTFIGRRKDTFPIKLQEFNIKRNRYTILWMNKQKTVKKENCL